MTFGDDSEQLFRGLIDLINKWRPAHYSNEGQYQEALYNYLKNLQEEGTIKQERTIRREAGETRADLRVSDVAIELKKDISSKSEMDRAENQIRLMLKEFNFVIVVCVGKSRKESIDLFSHHLKDFISDGGLLGEGRKGVKVIEIKDGDGKGDKRKSNQSPRRDENYNPLELTPNERGGLFGNFEMPKIEMPDIKIPKLRF